MKGLDSTKTGHEGTGKGETVQTGHKGAGMDAYR